MTTSHRIDQLDTWLRRLNREYSALVEMDMSLPGDAVIEGEIARNWRDWEEAREQLQREREVFLAGEKRE